MEPSTIVWRLFIGEIMIKNSKINTEPVERSQKSSNFQKNNWLKLWVFVQSFF